MSKKILVVDDTKNIRTLLTTCLQISGYEVSAVENGQKALALLDTESFDLVFLDIRMAEMSGTEVLRRMRNAQIHIPVIIMTAYATIKNAVECTKLGAVYYLQKPFSAERVISILEEIWEEQFNIHTLQGYIEKSKELINLSKTQEAYQLLKKALSINPSSKEAYLTIAQMYEKESNYVEAKRFRAIANQFTSEVGDNTV